MKYNDKASYVPDFTMQDLIDIKAHFGHRVLNPQMRGNIFGIKNGIHILDIRKTYFAFVNALDVVYQTAKQGKKILFVGTGEQFSDVIKKYAEKCNQYYINKRWLGGMITNWYTVSRSIKTLTIYDKLLSETDSQLTKKEIVKLSKHREKLSAALSGIVDMKGRPDLIFVIDSHNDHLAIQEAKSLGIPTISLVDTNSSIANITYPIPANNDSIASVDFYLSKISSAVLAGIQDDMKKTGLHVDKISKKDESDSKIADNISVESSEKTETVNV